MLDRYFARVGLDGTDHALPVLHRAHVTSIPYENLDVRLGREIRLDIDALVAKLVDARRGGYCFEQNTLFAHVLEAVGYQVTRCLGRVRISDATSPRPATHMVLLVEGCAVDVGFGSAVPLGPVPLGGSATYGPWTWSTEPWRSPEGDDAWLMKLFDLPMFSFTEEPRHPTDFVAPNHLTATHPTSIFRQLTIVQRWDGETQLGLNGLALKERRPDWSEVDTVVDAQDYGDVLRDAFGITVEPEDVDELLRL